jgi:DNA-directed RNA polymerase specialized sigma24 family protein
MGIERTRSHWFTEELMGRQLCWFHDYVSPHRAEYMSLARRLSDSTRAARRIVSEAEVEVISSDHREYITDPRRYMLRLVFDIAVQRFRSLHAPINAYVAPVPVDTPERSERKGENDIVLAALDRVPSLYRRAFLMRRVKGLTPNEIAKNLKLSPAKAMQRLVTATVMFCNALDEETCVPARACALTDGYLRGDNG